MKKTNTYVILKTVLYRTISVSLNWLVLYLLTGSASKSSQYAIYLFILHTVLYMAYERIVTIYEEKHIYGVKDE